MIKFQTNKYEIDLSHLPISFNEVNDYFTTEIIKSFSDPLDVDISSDVFEKLNLITIENISKYNNKVYGNLIINNRYYEGYIAINEVKDETAEITIFYGKETLDVFDKKLNELPFNTTNTNGSLVSFANTQITKSWPEVTHNFPKIFNDAIKTKSGYELFENFINNYKYNGVDWEFTSNSIDNIDGVNTIVNRNVMTPCVYLMEILKTGFKTEGLEVRGDFADAVFNHKILLVPKTYFEQYSANEFLNYSFSTPTSQETIDGKSVNVYTQTHTPSAEGTYKLDMRINLSSFQAAYFKLTIEQNSVVLYNAFSKNNAVFIDESININVATAAINKDIVVTLKLYYQTTSIANFNSFNYSFTEGKLNIFPTSYNVANFLPNITFKKLLNKLKTMFNISFTYTENAVYINYLENQLEAVVFNDLSETDQPKPRRILNKNNLFKLTYPDTQELLVDKNGQTYNQANFTSNEIETIEIEILPLKVLDKDGVVTAVYPEEEEDVMFILYNGPISNEPLAIDKIDNQSLSLQDTYDLYYRKWLQYRANAETYNDSFILHGSKTLNIKEGIYKYNKHHLIKSINKQHINNNYWNIEIETETL
jgi:hypothetical protein